MNLTNGLRQRMHRPRTTSLAAPPPGQAHDTKCAQPTAPNWRELAPIVVALIVVLVVMEASPKAGPALRAHRATIRQQGRAAAAIGGAEAMEATLQQVADADPLHAEERTRIIAEAWSDLPGWRA